MEYSISYFIEKLSAIPEEMWCTNTFADDEGHFCTYGHLGVKDFVERYRPEPMALRLLLNDKVEVINDFVSKEYPQPTPKQRILAALYEKKAEEAIRQAEAIISEPCSKEYSNELVI